MLQRQAAAQPQPRQPARARQAARWQHAWLVAALVAAAVAGLVPGMALHGAAAAFASYNVAPIEVCPAAEWRVRIALVTKIHACLDMQWQWRRPLQLLLPLPLLRTP